MDFAFIRTAYRVPCRACPKMEPIDAQDQKDARPIAKEHDEKFHGGRA